MRELEERVKEHQRACRLGQVEKSALAEHLCAPGDHVFDWSKVEELEKEPRTYRRKFKESIYIRKNKDDTINWSNGTQIDQIWIPLLLEII